MTAMTEEFKQAVVKGDVKACVALLDGGAGIEARDVSGWTALHYSSFEGHVHVCMMFLDRGADMASNDKDGWCALHCASAYGHVDVCIALLDRGADLQAKTNDGFTPIDLAEKNHPEIIDAIRAWLCRKQAVAVISDLVAAPTTALKPARLSP